MKVKVHAGRILADRSGAVALLFAVALPGLLGVTSVAVDYADGVRQRTALKSAADAAALNAARELIISEPDATRAHSVAVKTVTAHLTGSGANNWSVMSSLSEDKHSVNVTVKRPIKSVFSKFTKKFGLNSGANAEVEVIATARLTHNSRLCLLAVGDNVNTGVYMHKNARMTAANCSIHSNSAAKTGVLLEEGSKLKADLLCSRGGFQNMASTMEAQVLSDCPIVQDPLRARPAPVVGACTSPSRKVIKTGTITLSPGVYCGGVEISGTAVVTLNPGIYVFKAGSLQVKGAAQLSGKYVGLYFTGNESYFKFDESALVELTGPKDGDMAGLLIWRDKVVNQQDKVSGKWPALTNTIGSNRVMKLTGTIYLPQGSLYISAKGTVAQASDYTVILARKLELFDGPELVLNTNYAASDTPVPNDLGPIGLKDLRLQN